MGKEVAERSGHLACRKSILYLWQGHLKKKANLTRSAMEREMCFKNTHLQAPRWSRRKGTKQAFFSLAHWQSFRGN